MFQQLDDISPELKIAEKYLKEMLKADDTQDFELYIKRYEKERIAGFNADIFNKDIKQMQERNGANLGYEFLGSLRNQTVDGLDVFRSVWKGVYQKRDAVIEIGIYEKKGVWYLIRSSVH